VLQLTLRRLLAPEAPTAQQRSARPELEWRVQCAKARVRFVGEIHGEEKNAWLSAVDAFVLPSRVLPSGRSEDVPGALL
jgi:glycosyltransferase involved in cell wall biosynthesis